MAALIDRLPDEGAMSADRERKLRERGRAAMAREAKAEGERLRERSDWGPPADYFLGLLESGEASPPNLGRPVAAFMCQTVPLELLEAHGFQPHRLRGGFGAAALSGSAAVGSSVCPACRAAIGTLGLWEREMLAKTVFAMPSSCHWAAKFPEMMELAGLKAPEVLRIEIPKLSREARSHERYLGEMEILSRELERISGIKIRREDLLAQMARYGQAHREFSKLVSLKRQGILPFVHFAVACSAFQRDRLERWAQGCRDLAVEASAQRRAETVRKQDPAQIFLTGSPVFFPDLKIPRLMEAAGLSARHDDLCSGERLFPGPESPKGRSLAEIIEAACLPYYSGTLCPALCEARFMLNNISAKKEDGITGAVAQVQKGCQIFEFDAMAIDEGLRDKGLKFLRLETDISQEDQGALLTRLEAFRASLGEGR